MARARYAVTVFSQVVLSLQLPFAVVPLILLPVIEKIMDQFANSPRTLVVLASVIGIVILRCTLIGQVIGIG